MADVILVARLKQVYWPDWLAAYYKRHDPRKSGPVCPYLDEQSRGGRRGYDVQRTRFFLREIENGIDLEPILVESRCFQYRVGSPISWGNPEVTDGHHRYVAAVLSRMKNIRVSFGGLVDHLRWLKGEIDEIEEE